MRPWMLLVGALLYVLYAIGAEPDTAPVDGAGSWTIDLLAAIGNTQPTAETIAYLEAWHRAEGGTAAYNWLNTTQGAVGATDYNSVGVKNYPDAATGIQATATTLTNGRYPNTLAGLLTNAPIVDDAEMATWGTGGAALRAQLAAAPAVDDTRAQLVAYALSLQGIPYISGGRSAAGGDCSGTMQHIYLTVTGIDIGGTTFSQWPNLQAIDTPEPGDLAYFAGFSDGDEHVGMVADVNGDGVYDLINNGGHQADMHVDLSFMDDPYFNQHFKGYRRAL